VFDRVVVVGTGLIGGSFAAALRRRGLAARIVGFSPPDGERALRAGLVDALADDLGAAVRGADLVVLAAPVSANATLVRTLGACVASLAAPALITDLSSVKAPVAEAAVASLGAALRRYVPSHPIAGGERSGPEAADADLFRDRMVIVSPLEQSAPDAVSAIERLWRSIGARTRRMDVATHDRLYAAISHWPHAIAFALASTLAARLTDDEAMALVGPGLRDMTRIAMSDAALWADILLANAGPVAGIAAEFETSLGRIRDAVASGDRDALIAQVAAAADWRRRVGDGRVETAGPAADPAADPAPGPEAGPEPGPQAGPLPTSRG
jgi:prephenate dehydrogenase